MDKTDFFNVLWLAYADVRVIEPDAVGIGLLVAHRCSRTGEIELQIGSNIPDDVFIAAEIRKKAHG